MNKDIFLDKKFKEKKEKVLNFKDIEISQTADEQYREQLQRHEVKKIKNYNGNIKNISKLQEGYGASYELELIDLRLDIDNIECSLSDFDSDIHFTAPIIEGEYEFYAKHPMWEADGIFQLQSGEIKGIISDAEFTEDEDINEVAKNYIDKTATNINNKTVWTTTYSVKDWVGGGYSMYELGKDFTLGTDDSRAYDITDDDYPSYDAIITYVKIHSEDLSDLIMEQFEQAYDSDKNLDESKKNLNNRLHEYIDDKDRDFFNFVCDKYNIKPTNEIEDFFGMLTSVYTYGGDSKSDEELLKDHYIKKYHVSDKIKKEFINEVRKYGNITRDTYTDSEGLSYSSLNFDGFNESIKSNKKVLNEANRIYNYTVVLEQPEPERFRMRGTPKYKTMEEAEQMATAWNTNMSKKAKDYGCKFVAQEITSKERKTAKRDSQSEDYVNPFEVGDIICGDVGYTMSIPVWYEVMRVTPTCVFCNKLNSKVVDSDAWGQSGEKMPIPGSYSTENHGYSDVTNVRFTVKKGFSANATGKEAYRAVHEGHSFRIWDGKSCSFDTYD